MLKLTCTEAGGMVLTSVLMVANWWPCSASSSLITVSARLILAGSYWLSTVRPTFSFLKRSRTSETDDRAQALVVDLADIRLLADKDVQDDALFRVLALDAQIVEVARVPERVEVALDRDRVVGIADMGKQAGQDGFLGDAAVADDANLRRWSADSWARAVAGANGQRRARAKPAKRARARSQARGTAESASVREMEVCLIFTGLEPCGEHKCWCVP